MEGHELVRLLIFGGFLTVLAYVVVRVGSFAYFRTKMEHFRSVLKEINKGEQ